MDKFNQIITLLVSILGIMSIIMPFVIEFVKSMIGSAKIVTWFGNLERFCAVISAVFGLIIYIFVNVMLPETFANCNTAQKIVIGIVFTFANAMASQIGYDKIIKWIINRK